MKRSLAILLCFLLCNLAFAGTTLVIYVKGGTSAKDQSIYTALTQVVSQLNSTNNSNGHTYELTQVETFAAAREYISEKSGTYSAVAGVALGVFTDGVYTGNVKETGGAQPEVDVEDIFMTFAHCGVDGLIDSDQVGHIIASTNPGDTYPSGGGSGGGGGGSGGGGGGGGGHYEYYSAQEWIYYTQPNGHLASYLGWVTIAIWVENDPNGIRLEA